MLKPGDIAIISGARTPMGRYGGKLRDFTAQDLAAVAAKGAMERAGVEAKEFDHAVFGNAQQTSGDALYGARHVALKAGLPIETPALTVNRLCGSGMQAIVSGAQKVLEAHSRRHTCARGVVVSEPSEVSATIGPKGRDLRGRSRRWRVQQKADVFGILHVEGLVSLVLIEALPSVVCIPQCPGRYAD